MTARTLMVAVMVTITAVSTEKCQKLDPVLWDYPSCPYPESNEWIRLKNKMKCDKDHDYHCASNSQGCDVQLCVKRTYCEAGHHTLLDPVKDTAICAPCPQNRYQTTGFWSNERTYCEHEKTKCDSIGQIECQPGSTITDRSCRCNIHQNLALQSYALHNETCCTKNDPWCECIQFKSPCPNGTVRHDNYKCLKECPPNSFRPWDSETCYPNSTTVTVERTTADQTPASGSTGLPDTVNVGLIVGFILGGLALVGLIVGLCVYHIMKKRKKGRPGERTSNGHINGQEQVDMVNGHIDGQEPVHMANGHIDGREPLDMANGHIDEQEPVDMEEEDTEKKYLLQSPSAEAGSSTKGIGKDLRENTISNKEEEATEKDHLLQSEAGSSTKGKDLRENKISNEVTVKNHYQDCVIIIRQTKTNIHDGRGNTFNLGKNNKTKTTLIENPVTGNEDIVMFESIKSTSGRISSVEENPDNQLNSHSHDNQWNSHSHDNQWNSHSHDNQPQPDISRIGSSSEETAVKLTGSDPHESMEEVRTEEMCKSIQDDDNCSNDETKKKDFFSLQKK